MTKTFKGGEIPKSPSASGILIGGKVTLEEHVFLEEAKELGEELTPDNVKPYHKTKIKYKDHKESNKPGRILTRREINKEQWEKIIMAQTTIDSVIIGALLSGREIAGTELMNIVLEKVPEKLKTDYSCRSSYMFHKTDFGKFVTDRQVGNGKMFKLVTAALDCTVDELLPFLYKEKVDERLATLDKHIALRPFLEQTKPEKQIEVESVEFKPDEPKVEPEIVNLKDFENIKKTNEKVNTAIESAISKVINELGINVTVNGKVEFVFKWGN